MSTWNGTVPPLNLKATEVYDTKRQQELREEAKRIAEAAQKLLEARDARERAQWRRLVGRTITAIEGAHEALRLTLDDGSHFIIEPSEWATYSIDAPNNENLDWKDVTR